MAIPFTTVKRDDAGCYDPKHPTRLHNPFKHDVWARLSASIAFPAHIKGMRQAWTRKNGLLNSELACVSGYLTHSHYGGFPTGNSNSFPLIGPFHLLQPNDYWELIAYQNSGTVMTLQPLNCQWFQIEFDI